MESRERFVEYKNEGGKVVLNHPQKMPNASSYLWNSQMMIQVNCQGYAVSQFMQPEPAKYAHPPSIEAKTFMQPEQPFYAHHPGRFCYVKDEDTQEIFSAPYAPVKKSPTDFAFINSVSSISWEVCMDGLLVTMRLSLSVEDVLELWTIEIKNLTTRTRRLSLYPYFPVGYMSWMNQSGKYDNSLGAVICSSITPYQKYQDYEKIKTFKDKTFLLGEQKPDAWEVNQATFEGAGGLSAPDGVLADELGGGDAIYETPTCAMQYRLSLDENDKKGFRFLFGPARDESEVQFFRQKYFDSSDTKDQFEAAATQYADYIIDRSKAFEIRSPDQVFDHYVNQWLPRQIHYHGETNRLCTDPQTRNFLQDQMGLSYTDGQVARKAFLQAISQQSSSGAMPEGILIDESAELKYINQIPHTDHCIWLPVCLKAYLDETNDYAILDVEMPFADSEEAVSVVEHINRAMDWLISKRDHRGLSFIDQGDWCDPMNMVGYRGKGVSGWLTMAVSYALQTWSEVLDGHQENSNVARLRAEVSKINEAINVHLWDGNWYARGITDDNVTFGVSTDPEGKIFLNTQSWALLCGCADDEKELKMLNAVEELLESPYGLAMLAPPFTQMREDVGRVTQKFPGSAENGSIYNHAAAFYIYALYKVKRPDTAFRILRKMIPGPEEADLLQRGQLPVFIPNYYRGAHELYPRTSGRSSQLFNTGTVHWVYRSIIDGLLGLQGSSEGMVINPQLPEIWDEVEVVRYFRGAKLNFKIKNSQDASITVNGEAILGNLLADIEKGKEYNVEVGVYYPELSGKYED